MIEEVILTTEMIWLTLAITGLMLIVGRVKIGGDKAVNRINRLWWWGRFGTLIALAIGVSSSFIPGAVPDGAPIAHQVFFGIIAATFSVTTRNSLKDILFKKLEDKR